VENQERILHILKRNGPATVGGLAETLELSRSATRHHLRVLERGGLVAPLGTTTPAGVGRPGLLYGLTPYALSIFPHGYDRLANGLLREIKSLLEPAQVIRLCERIGREIAAQAPRRQPQQPIGEYLRAVTNFLTARGYLAEIAEEDGQWQLRLSNCPYAYVAQAHAEVCWLDQVMLRQVISEEIKPIHLWVNGARGCSFSIPFSS
jgi:predicted ArsR family transcriptional regulator